MIIVEILNAKTQEITERRNILILDGHSHMGSDEDGQKMMNPLAPGGTYDFYAKLQTKMRENWRGNTLNYQINNTIYQFHIASFPFSPVHRRLSS